MEDNANLIESLLERATEYGKTSYELVKLKTLEKTSDVVSSFVPNSVVIVVIIFFMLFLSLGLSFWLGEILGKIYYGFLVVGAFYGFTGFILHFFMHKWLKKVIGNHFIKKVLK
jgi:fatty acid desaturase